MIILATCSEFLHHGTPVAHDDRFLLEALTCRGLQTCCASWDDPTVRWDEAEIVVVRSTWDYIHRPHAFLRWTQEVGRVSRLFNPAEAIAWNSDKQYLLSLQKHDIPLIPTLWLAQGKPHDLATLLAEQQWPRAVLKPTVGANCYQTLHFDVAQITQAQQHLEKIFAGHADAMLQPYLEQLNTHKEIGHCFLAGKWSHAFARLPFTPNEPGRQLSEQVYGATGMPSADIALARRIYRAIEEETNTQLLYARIDLVTGNDGQKVLMEAEIIEPVLRLDYPGALDRFVATLQARVQAQSVCC